MTDKVSPIATDQRELCDCLRELLQMAEAGELRAIAAAGIVRSKEDGEIEQVHVRSGAWDEYRYTMVGNLEVVKLWLARQDAKLDGV